MVRIDGKIYRAVLDAKVNPTRELLASPWLKRLIDDGVMPKTFEVAEPTHFARVSGDVLWLRHQPLPMPCYPHEITALQLFDSGQITLKVAIAAAEHGWTLKDASAWNVLHSGGRGRFVDFLSFEKREFTGHWLAYGQFARHFLLPLLLYRKTGLIPPEIFMVHRDGITPERAYSMLGFGKFFSMQSLELSVLPTWLSAAGGRMIRSKAAHSSTVRSTTAGRAVYLGLLRRLQRFLGDLRPRQSKKTSVWEKYEEDRTHYSDADLAAKKQFVIDSLKDSRSVLDVGCNAGEFSLLAANDERSVMAADFDHAAVSRLYERLRGAPAAVMPIILNIARPTPPIGWENREVMGFLERSRGNFDCIMVLGLVHHLLVSERASLDMVVDLLANLRPRRVIFEWVTPEDPKFSQIAGLNASLYRDISTETFEILMQRHFTLERKLYLPCGTRVMYLWSVTK